MSVDPFAPFEAAANSVAPPIPNFGAAQPFAPRSDIPAPPVAPPIAPSYADIADVPTLDQIELRDYSEADSRLKVNNPHPDLDYRWVNSDSDRYALLYRRGFRPVRNPGAAASDEASETPQLRAGTQRDGAGRRAILMARPKHFSELQRENHRRMIRARQAQLDPKSYSGNQGRDSETFKGHITIDGGS
jgi:hypothetical protein